MKTAFSWMSCIVFLLCYSTQSRVILAGKRQVERKSLSAWKDVSDYQGDSVHVWENKGDEELYTEVCGGCSSWFTTPLLYLPKTSYLVMEASCAIPPCQFQINGTSRSFSDRRLASDEIIQNVTYENQSSKTITIEKPYSYLRINAQNIGSTKIKFQIFSMEMYHYFCDETTKYNANLKKMDSSTANISKLVRCRDNATARDGSSTSITVMCTPKGEWIAKKDQQCVCNKSFYLNNEQCSFCPINTYKNAIGNEKCRECPHGKTPTIMRTECECKEDHYVAENDDGKCYEKNTTTPTSTSNSEPTGAPKESKPKDNMFIYIGAGVAFLVIVLLIIALIITRLRRDKWRKSGKENLGFESVPLPPLPAIPDTSPKTYVDPLIYVDVLDAVQEFANEINPQSLCLDDLIGAGEFGHVYKGKLTLEDGKSILVAAKTLKSNADDKSIRDFLLEASAMGQFDDPNVIHLEGVITKVVLIMIVLEFMSNGSLDHFLKKNEGGFTAVQLFSMARGVASGMKYLAAMNFIHRDLAARNILVDENMICKVADFGLSRELETSDSSEGEYLSQGGKIAVRWTAPEAIKYRIFSTASDVWSFGILLWEIMSAAQRPYGDWDNFKVMVRVDEGFRLPSPVNCPQAVHELMLKCWNKDHILRPRFEDILAIIDEWIKSPESLII